MAETTATRSRTGEVRATESRATGHSLIEPEASESPAATARSSADAAPIGKLAKRDGAIALAGLSAWAATDAWFATTGLGFASLLSIVNGALVGVALGAMAHEWGHFGGARMSGGVAPTRGLRSFYPLFRFDLEANDPDAFRAMSVGGNVAHWLAMLALLWLLPMDTPGRVALVSGAFGFATFASVTELPIIRRAFGGVAPAKCFEGLTGALLRRNQWIGALAGLVFALI